MGLAIEDTLAGSDQFIGGCGLAHIGRKQLREQQRYFIDRDKILVCGWHILRMQAASGSWCRISQVATPRGLLGSRTTPGA